MTARDLTTSAFVIALPEIKKTPSNDKSVSDSVIFAGQNLLLECLSQMSQRKKGPLTQTFMGVDLDF